MNTETFSKQFPIALGAIADHIHDHHLPVPLSIETDLFENSITVVLAGLSTHDAWLNSVVIDSEDNEPRESLFGPVAGSSGRYVRTIWLVRLPGLGIQLRLRGSRPYPLSVVSA